ncbi:MAG: hypothetical protein C0460_13510 [Methylibium sp.]|jgi:AraC-like DNA-binding protein|nr:hypothetical protein [Methylibium sp.]|mmetsp:Transcript_39210/g.92227  ORF Transcript_39210/g.92227 Transcript_39210/m.92227 type:complete len:280 (-) Transcript_39210:559-1398(-)
MISGLAYHAVASAMEDRHRFDGRARFVMAIKTCVDGHVPYGNYRRAASLRRAAGWSDETARRAVRDWLQSDLNPAVQLGRLAASRAQIVALYNLYNNSVDLPVRTRVIEGQVARMLDGADSDDELCAAGSLAVLHWISQEAEQRRPGQTADLIPASGVARYLGVEDMASAEAMRLLEAEGDHDLCGLAAILGSSIRTLQRQLSAEGLTATDLRLAARQQKALRLLSRGLGLCLVATVAGYADQAHMARSIKAACGMTPRSIAALFRAAPDGSGQAAARP